MSGKRVLALYAAILFSFAVILCRLYFLEEKKPEEIALALGRPVKTVFRCPT